MSTELGRLRLRAFALLAAMFVVGAVTGAGFVRAVGPRPGPPPPGHDPFRHLDLTAEQRARADQILERRRPELDAIVAETAPKVRAIHESIEKELSEVLTPEQVRRLEELKQHPPPPPNGPPGRGPLGPPPHGPPGGPMGPPPPGFDPMRPPPPAP